MTISDGRIARRQSAQLWLIGYVIVIGGGLMLAAFARRRITEPFIGLSLGLFLLVLLAWLIRPRVALYVTIGLTAVSDIVTVDWFPFVKNFSSRESISFISDAATTSPLDVSLFVGVAVTTMRHYAATGRLMSPSPLNRPVLVFTGFVMYGFARGLTTGGDPRVAVLEGRALLYLVLVVTIAGHVFTRPEHLRIALWWLLAGVLVQSLLSVEYFNRLDAATRAATESLNEHGSSIGQNLLILAVISLFLFRASAATPRLLLLAALVPTMFVYLVAQRRAGVASLAIGVLLLLALLFWRRRRLFWVVAPITMLITTVYLGAFWNSDSTLGFPAQAIKSIIAPGSATAADRSSDLYRLIEAFDLNYTIRSDPLKGIGFGRPFYRPITLPDISAFELNAYLPHNSILWIWIKTGFGGFVAMLYLIAKTVMLGANRARRLPDGIDVIVAQCGLLFVVMFSVYTYVDVSWDSRNVVFLGLACAICASPLPTDRPADDQPTTSTVLTTSPMRSA